MQYYAEYDSPMGVLLLVSDGTALTGLYPGRSSPEQPRELGVFDRAKAWLDDYFRGEDRDADFPIRASGTPFQQLVWQRLSKIPFGETVTYGQIAGEMAKALGKEKMSAQAVGQAVGKNPVSIIVPCHRVMGAGGKLTGYESGLDNKKWLLGHEGWNVAAFRD